MDQQHRLGRTKLPNLKKLLDPVCEELRNDILEVLGASGVCFECYELKDHPTNEWYKLHKGLWDEHTGVLGRSYEPPSGSRVIYNFKKRLMGEILSSFSSKYDDDINKNIDPLPSFVMAKNLYNEYNNMMKQHIELKSEEKKKKEELQNSMKLAEEQMGIGLNGLRNQNLTLMTPPKTSTHSTSLTLNENASTINAISSKGGSSKKSSKGGSSQKPDKSENNPMTPIQDTIGSINSFIDLASKNTVFDLSKDFSSSFGNESCDLISMKRKLEIARETWRFAKESGNEERAIKKLKIVNDLEDEIETSISKEGD